jgi:hypothetical protein
MVSLFQSDLPLPLPTTDYRWQIAPIGDPAYLHPEAHKPMRMTIELTSP